jgi:DNA-binding response OmpR family regulator
MRKQSEQMNKVNDTRLIILVVEDVHETRDGIEKLLKADGYRVALARDEPDAIESAQRDRPDLILVRSYCYRASHPRACGCWRAGAGGGLLRRRYQ